MANRQNKLYPIFFFGFFIFFLFTIHSYYFNAQKSQSKLIKAQSQNKLFNSKRNLDEIDITNKIYESDPVSSTTSSGFQEYNEIDLDDDPIECPDKDKGYIKALIAITNSIIKKEINELDEDSVELDDDEEFNKKKKKYLKRIMPSLFFSIISLICFLGFIACWVCYDCRCFTCIQKKSFLTPLYIANFIFYLTIFCICIYGFSQLDNIFKGVEDVQNSYLDFFNTVLYGKKTTTSQKWIGINTVFEIFDNLNSTISQMNYDDDNIRLNYYMDNINITKNNFSQKLKNTYKSFFENDEITPLKGFYMEYPNSNDYYIYNEDKTKKLYLKKKYVLDIIPTFGRYHPENESFDGLVSIWNEEFSENYIKVKDSMDKIRISYINVIENNNNNTIKYQLENAKNKLLDIKRPFEIIYRNRKDSINKYNKKYGNALKVMTKLIFALLFCLSILKIGFIIILLLDSKYFSKFKVFLHIIWNIFSFLMILSFITGSILALIGRLGKDLASVYSYIVSKDNFFGTNPVIIPEFKRGKEILEKCFLKEGDLSGIFGLKDYIDVFNTINKEKNEILIHKEIFNNLMNNYPAYNVLKTLLDKKTEFINDTYLYYYDTSQIGMDMINNVKLDDMIKSLNDSIDDINNQRWSLLQGDRNFQCFKDKNEIGTPEKNLFNPWTCEPIDRDCINDIKNFAKISSDIIDLLKYANGTKNPGIPGFQNYYDILNKVKKDYGIYLNTTFDALEFFEDFTSNITNILKEGINENNTNNTLAFLNGKVIKDKFKILLEYLKNSLGKNMFTVGICLIVIGCILIISISSFILLMIIIQMELSSQKKEIVSNKKYNNNIINNNINNNTNNITNSGTSNHNNLTINQELEEIDIHSNNFLTSDQMGSGISSQNNIGNHIQNNNYIYNNHHYSQPRTTQVNGFYSPNLNGNNLNLNKIQDEFDAESIKMKISALRPEIKINKLKINLIFFFEKDITKENVDIYNSLKLQVSGVFLCVKFVNILKNLLDEIKSLDTSFILISTGSSFEKIEYFCYGLNCIKYIILFCFEVNKYKLKYGLKKKVKLVSGSIDEINKYLEKKSGHLQDYDKNLKDLKDLTDHTPIISLYEYEKYYYIYHKILAFFFKEDFSILSFSEGYKEKIFNFVDENTNYEDKQKQELKDIINKIKKSNNFLKASLNFYTKETEYVYLFNLVMRKIEEGLERLSFLIGPMYYSMVRYLKEENPSLALNKDITLFRKISIKEYELNLYEMYQNEIICFPSFTSTSITKNFSTTANALQVNNVDQKEKINILMVLHYKYQYNNIYQGMFLNKYFSVNSHEQEVLLFPFTFIKVNSLERANDEDDYIDYILDCDILNRDCILEFELKKGKKIVIDDDNVVTVQ